MAAKGYVFSAAITTSATQLSATSKNTQYGFTIKAPAANTGTVYFGYANTVTGGTSTTFDGMPLAAGESYYIPRAAADDVNDIWAIGSTGTQKLHVEGC